MKCIHCQHDSKFKERPGKRCPKCNHDFAFEPRQGDPFTDGAFQAAIEAVSSHGHVRWGVENLYYEICRRSGRRRAPPKVFLGFAGILILLAILAAVVNVYSVAFLATVAAFILAVVAATRSVSYGVSLSVDKFNTLWTRWVEVHGRPDSLIVRAAPRGEKPPPRNVEPDIADYSFDRAVICDRARTVDVLLANNFHFENNCAVLALNGYPEGPFETVRAMLKRNPKLQVFVLHDATLLGCTMALRLSQDPEWFAGHAKVIDVGIRPGQTDPFRGLFFPGEPVVTGEGLTPQESAWLGKYSLEIAAIRPEQVLKRLFRAINRKPEAIEPEVEDVNVDLYSFSSSATDSDSGVDSFG